MSKTYSHPSNARRAARAALGKGATEGVDYRLEHTANPLGICFMPIAKAPAKTAAKAKTPKGPPSRKTKAGGTKTKAKAAAKPKAKTSTNGQVADQLQAMLERPEGCTAIEVGKAFGWLEHTSRARISTMLRPRGIKVVRTREDRKGSKTPVSVYRAERQLPLGEKREALGNRSVKKAAAKKAGA